MRDTFRETLWFKKGLLDAEAAQTQSATETGPIKVDMLPVEDRYLDDGSLVPDDSVVFGLHTGTTQLIEPIHIDAAIDVIAVPERSLIAEMKTGRRLVLAMIALATLALGGAAMMIV